MKNLTSIITALAFFAAIPAHARTLQSGGAGLGGSFTPIVNEIEHEHCRLQAESSADPQDLEGKYWRENQWNSFLSSLGAKYPEVAIFPPAQWDVDVSGGGAALVIRSRADSNDTIRFVVKGCTVTVISRKTTYPDGAFKGWREFDRTRASVREIVVVPQYKPLEEIYAPCRDVLSQSQFDQLINISRDASKIAVAVLDMGLDYNDPQYAYRIARDARGEPYGSNADEKSYPFNFQSDIGKSDQRHGRWVAAVGLESSRSTRVVPIRMEDFRNFDKAVKYAEKSGARVINFSQVLESDPVFDRHSLDQYQFDLKTRKEVIQKLANTIRNHPHLLFVAAAGNSWDDNDVHPALPAGLVFPNLISVASVNAEGKLSTFSSYGKNTVAIAALGERPKTARHEAILGTSFAAPAVAFAAGDILAENPSLQPSDVIRILTDTADKSGDLIEKVSSGGILNHDRAVEAARHFRSAASGPSVVRGEGVADPNTVSEILKRSEPSPLDPAFQSKELLIP